MPTREQLELIKRATVAIALVPDQPPADDRETPFTIVGTGFCIDPDGIVITCEHVLRAFAPGIRQAIAALPNEKAAPGLRPLKGLSMLVPHVLFFVAGQSEEELLVLPVPVSNAVAKLEYDLGAIRVQRHAALPSGYPALAVEPFEDIYEGMDLATCGFPLGNDLQHQLGTMTSSFTRGILSSVAPAANSRVDLVTGFQLDITATFGNSGGPVFSWSSGRVLGVLQGGPTLQSGKPLPGLARAEPIYRILRDGTLDRLKALQPGSLPPGMGT
jgi:S1-C subfamily serine protease